VGPAAVETRDGGYRGLFTTDAVAAGDLLASVPRSCLIWAEEADIQSSWGLTLPEFLTANLVGSRLRGECAPYMDELPASEALLADWQSDELDALQCPHLKADANGQRERVEEILENVQPWAAGADAATASALGGAHGPKPGTDL